MLRSAARKVLWLAKGVALLGGFAVGLALILGVATTALAAVPGDPFELGQTNTINNALTKLAGSNAGTMLTVDNNSSASGARGLDLRVEPGKQPLNVNAEAGKAGNLNADEVDGKDADQIGVNGIEAVFEDSDNDSDSPKGTSAVCPEGKVVVGTGYRIISDTASLSDIAVTELRRRGDGEVRLNAEEVEPIADDWLVEAEAICATEGTP